VCSELGAEISNKDFKGNGRLIYMPYSGIPFRNDNPEKNYNGIFNSPDEYDIGLQSNSELLLKNEYCVNNDNMYLIAKYNYNLSDSLTNRFISEFSSNSMTIFVSGLGAITKKYFYTEDIYRENLSAISNMIKSCSRYYFSLNRLFIKDNDIDNNKLENIEYILNRDEMINRIHIISNDILAGVIDSYSSYIDRFMYQADIDTFAKDEIAQLDINLDSVSTDAYYPYINSILHEQANLDMRKIREILDFSLFHNWYLFTSHYYSPSNKMIDNKATNNRLDNFMI
jgi:hypothetical protein